ncbi:MAG: TolC family protein [Vicinamibacteria bacterium]
MSVVLLLATMGGSSFAFEAFSLVGDPTLDGLVATALRGNPELRAAEESLSAARARVPQAGALPDPVATVSYQNGGHGWSPGADNDTGVGIAVRQDLPFAGKRRLAQEVETREAERAGHLVSRVRLSLVYRVRVTYAELLRVRENLVILEDQRRALHDIEELTRSRYAVGLAGQSDVLRAQAELARLGQARIHEEGQEASAVAELNRLLARPAGTPVEPAQRLVSLAERPLGVPSLEEVLAGVDAMSPDVAADAAMVARSEAALQLARRMSKPDFSALASYLNRGSLPPIFAVDVGVALPLYKGRKQGQAVAEAEARLRSDQALGDAMRLRARAEAEKALADLRAAVGEAQTYTQGVLAVDALAVESAVAGFRAGKSPFVAVLEAHNALYKDRWQQADLLFHVLWHGARLDAWSLEN